MEPVQIDTLVALAEEADSALYGEKQGEGLTRLEAERENLHAALADCIQQGEDSMALRLCLALLAFWRMRGYIAEGRDWCEAVLRLEGAQRATKQRASLLNGAGNLARLQGDYAAAQARHEESLAIHDAIGDRKGSAASLNGLGNLASAQNDYASARRYYERSLAIKREIGDQAVIAGSLNNLGYLAYRQGDYASARRYYRESLTLRRNAGNANIQAVALAVQGLAEAATAEGDWKHAACLWGLEAALRAQGGASLTSDEQQAIERDITAIRQALSAEEFAAAYEQGSAMTLEQALDYALT